MRSQNSEAGNQKSEPRIWLNMLLPIAVLGLLVFVATWKLAIGNRIIARGDLLLYFYPLRDFASQAVREFRLPLWNPYTFMGSPFLANSQAGFFYPFNILTAWLPVERAVSWQIVLHLAIAAMGMYMLASKGLMIGRLASLISGVAFGLGGYLGAQVEHFNQLQVLAWLPLLILTIFDFRFSIFSRRAVSRILAMSGLLALQITAGHTQSLYISLVALGIVAIIHVAQRHTTSTTHRLSAVSPLLVLVAAGIFAAAICAIQLLPTLELSRESARAGGLPFNEAASFSWRPWVIARALLPTYGDPLFPEYVAYFGVTGLALVLLNFVSANTSIAHRSSIVAIVLSALGFVLALGVATPIFNAFYKFLPGFNLFRAQARWLVVFSLGMSMLIGLGAQKLIDGMNANETRRWLFAWLSLAVCLALGIWLGARFSPEAEYQSLPTRSVWMSWAIAFVVVTILSIGYRLMRSRVAYASFLLPLMLIVELMIASQFQPYARASDVQSLTSLRPSTAHFLAEKRDGRILALSGLFFDPGDKTEQELIYDSQLSKDELYDRIIASKHKEILSPNLSLFYRLPSVDGYDGGLLPIRRYAEYTHQFAPSTKTGASDGRLREFLKSVPSMRWLRQMSVRYIVADKTQDVFIDGVFYDLLFSLPISQTRDISLEPYESTRIGLVFGATQTQANTQVAVAEIVFDDQTQRRFDIRIPPNSPPDGFHTIVEFGIAKTPLTLRISPSDATSDLRLRGVTNIDSRDNTFKSQVVSSDALIRLAHSGDVKIYEIVNDGGERFSFQHEDTGTERVTEIDRNVFLIEERPEHITLQVESPAEQSETSSLIVRDTCYPGWVARVDGVETPIACADILFRKINVPPGKHIIEFSYEPQSIKIGAALSVLGVILWIVLFFTAFRSRMRIG
jgi:hypothetical protein